MESEVVEKAVRTAGKRPSDGKGTNVKNEDRITDKPPSRV